MRLFSFGGIRKFSYAGVICAVRIREWILAPFKDHCRCSLDVSSDESLLHSLLCCDSPFCAGGSYCKSYVKPLRYDP